MASTLKRYAGNWVMAGLMACAMVVAAVPAAQALPTPKDIDEAVKANNLPKAEDLLRQVLNARADSAKAHYELGQVLGLEGRHADALAELDRAKSLDASLRFAHSRQEFSERYQREERLAVTGTPLEQGGPAIQPHAPPASSNGMLGLVGVVALGLIAFIIYRRVTGGGNRQARAKAQLAQLVPLMKALDDAQLEGRAGQYGKAVTDQIQARIDALTRQVSRAIETTKGGTPLAEQDMAALTRDVDGVASWAATGTAPVAPVAPAAPAGGPWAAGPSAGPGPGPYLGQPQTMMGNNNSGPGFFSGLLVGEMLSGGNRDRIIERDVVVERDGPSRNSSEDRFDSGSGDSWGGSDSSVDSSDSSGW